MREKLKRVHIKSRSHKSLSTANDTKENTLRCDVNNNSSRILSSIQNHVKHYAHNGFNNAVEADKIKHPIDQSCDKTNGCVNGNANSDSSTVVKRFQEDRKSIR